MGIIDKFLPKKVERDPVPPLLIGSNSDVPGKFTAIGRTSKDSGGTIFGNSSPGLLLPPPSPDEDWQTFSLDSTTFSRMSPARMMELLADMSPEVSKALWDYLRMCNPGWDFNVYKPGTTSPHKEGKKIITETLDNWAITGRSLDTVFARMNSAAFLRGAMFTECVFDTDGRTSIALVTPDPISVRFRKEEDPILGEYWQLGQMQDAKFVALNRPTVQYIPTDPSFGPYGRPMASPAIFTGLFLLGLLHDLRRVVAQQGYPRIDISIDTEILMKMAPPEVRTSAEKLQRWIDEIVSQVKSVYSGLEPSDAYIHVSAIKLNDSVGVIDSDSLGSITGIIQALERMSIRALKTMPILMAVMEGASDANSNRQWEMQAQGIKSVQHIAEYIMQRNLSLVLQANSVQADVVWRFAELRSSEMLRDAQTETLLIANTMNMWTMGWISQDEAAMRVVKHLPDKPEPRIMPKAVTGEPAPDQDDEVGKSDGTPAEPINQKSMDKVASGGLKNAESTIKSIREMPGIRAIV